MPGPLCKVCNIVTSLLVLKLMRGHSSSKLRNDFVGEKKKNILNICLKLTFLVLRFLISFAGSFSTF